MSPALTLSSQPIPEFHPHSDGFGTRAIHVGSEADPTTGAVIPSISLSTTYKQDAVGVHRGFEYSRSGNPNRNAFEATLASIEAGGAEALAFSSGSATTATLIQSLGPNTHILSVNDVYGGTFRYMTKVAAIGQNVTTTFLDLEDADVDRTVEDKILASIHDNTRLVWIETPTNPTLRMIDVKRVVEVIRSHPHGARVLVLVDNTFLSPYYQSPLLLGADLVMHSITKYINGHSDVVMGALILPARHAELAERLRFFQNAIGAVPSPHDCWLAQRGLKTLHLRMKQHGVNALKIARWLEKEKEADTGLVEDVIYPGLGSHRKNDVAWRSLSPHAKKWIEKEVLVGRVASPVLSASSSQEDLTGTVTPSSADGDAGFPYGGMISFRIPGGFAEADLFLSSLRLFTLAESLGGVESLAEHPAKMTHGSIPEKERELLGIGDNLIRLSVGVEEVEDLIEDLRQALQKAKGVKVGKAL